MTLTWEDVVLNAKYRKSLTQEELEKMLRVAVLRIEWLEEKVRQHGHDGFRTY